MFITGEKFRKLRDAVKNGDERAIQILKRYMDDDETVGEEVDAYFAPSTVEVIDNEETPIQEEPMDKFHKFLKDNGVSEGDEDFDDYKEEFKKQFPNYEMDDHHHEEHHEEEVCGCGLDLQMLLDDEIEAIDGYNKQITLAMTLDIPEAKKIVLMNKLNEIKNEEAHHVQELQELMKVVK